MAKMDKNVRPSHIALEAVRQSLPQSLYLPSEPYEPKPRISTAHQHQLDLGVEVMMRDLISRNPNDPRVQRYVKETRQHISHTHEYAGRQRLSPPPSFWDPHKLSPDLPSGDHSYIRVFATRDKTQTVKPRSKRGWLQGGKKWRQLQASKAQAEVKAAQDKAKAQRIEHSNLYNKWLTDFDLSHTAKALRDFNLWRSHYATYVQEVKEAHAKALKDWMAAEEAKKGDTPTSPPPAAIQTDVWDDWIINAMSGSKEVA
jgi:hypothetical protein